MRHLKLFLMIATSLALILKIILMIHFPQLQNYPLYPILIMGGIVQISNILWKFIHGEWGADLLAALALIVGIVLKEYIAATLIVFMLASGQLLEEYATRQASSVLSALLKRMPKTVHLLKNNTLKDIPLESVKIGDIVVVYPFETCPVDGIVIEGHTNMDESYLTGEPYKISKAPGSMVISGALNGENLIHVQATELPKDSRYESIVQVIQDAQSKKPKLKRIADQLGAVFTPIVLIFAGISYFFNHDATRVLAILVTATPCPLLIAIPITIISAISLAAKNSIIIQDPCVLETLPNCQTAIFDKTGTLTLGKPKMSQIHLLSDLNEDEIIQFTASLERYSKHPLAQAILDIAQERHLTLFDASEISEKPGKGLEGKIHGHVIQITSRKHLKDLSVLPAIESGLECIILINQKMVASLIFHDEIRHETLAFIAHLKPQHHFKDILIVSGDKSSEVEYLASILNIEKIYAQQTPEQKLEIVNAQRKYGPVVFMGDGINDAPALHAADVGIAFGTHHEISAQSADAVIMESSLGKVDELIHLSQITQKIALQSGFFGIALSIMAMILASLGKVTPVEGAIIQEFIDVLAIMNSLRLVFFTKIYSDIKQ
ncbi:MAG TPA: cadmium-translocating P-type ATPase [Legionellales bacterium]|nr:cadmium-translocating P-type ATPase [Legionellales bacterium]